MRKLIIALILSSIFAVYSCAPTNKVLTTNIQDITSFEPNSFLYCLPKTRIIVSVTALRRTIVPGPYHEYAQKYLGIEGAPSISEFEWTLKDIQLSSLEDIDPEYYYSVANDKYGSVKACLNDLGKSGFVIEPLIHESIIKSDIPEGDETLRVSFNDLSVKTYFTDENQKKLSKPIKDTSFVKTPVLKKSLVAKTFENKAEEAANFILKTRKRRFKLISGEYEVFPEGIALETAIKELNKIEAEYLSLFIGKTYIDTIKSVFVYEPEPRQELQRSTLFRFSDETGIITSRSTEGKTVILEITDLGKTKILEQMIIPGTSPSKENMVFYRIPDTAEVKVLFGSYEIIKENISIMQFGAVIPYYIQKKLPKK